MEETQNRILSSLRLPLQFIAIIWAVHLFQVVTGFDFWRYGVYPRTSFGLRGILFSPLIHSDLKHLISNSAPFFFLSVMILYFYRRVAFRSILMIYFLSGLAVWIFARQVFHVGASGVVYGLVSFVFWMGIFRRSIKSIILALIVTFLYSGLFLGILPDQEGISWESHLLGGLVGIFVAYWYKEEIEADEEEQPPSWANDPHKTEFFLDRDIFEKNQS
jgi:membrane associated rhomboid family serine protease